jgi:acetolactate synthase I/II/III large subunit
MRSGGNVLVEALAINGVDTVFCVPGESYLDVLDAFYDRRDRIHVVTCRQEGGATFMAEAHGKLSGRPGIAFVTRGPGATNASIGVQTRRRCCSSSARSSAMRLAARPFKRSTSARCSRRLQRP